MTSLLDLSPSAVLHPGYGTVFVFGTPHVGQRVGVAYLFDVQAAAIFGRMPSSYYARYRIERTWDKVLKYYFAGWAPEAKRAAQRGNPVLQTVGRRRKGIRMSMSGLFERLHHLLTSGYPYVAVQHTDDGDYPHITYWDDARLLVIYEVFVADLAAAEDAYRAELYGISLARRALEEADEPFEFLVEVKSL